MVLTTTNCFNSIRLQNLNRRSSLCDFSTVFKSTVNPHAYYNICPTHISNSNLNTAWFDHIVIVAQAQLPPLVAAKCEEPAAEIEENGVVMAFLREYQSFISEKKQIHNLFFFLQINAHLSVTTAVCSSPQAII